MSTRAPRAHICTCACTHTHSLARTRTHVSLSPLTLTRVIQGHASSRTRPHGNEKGRKRAGRDRTGGGPALPQAAGQKRTHVSSLLSPRALPGPLAWWQGRGPQAQPGELWHGWSERLLRAGHKAKSFGSGSSPLPPHSDL